jgi:hypothetical protein
MGKAITLIDRRIDKTVTAAAFAALEEALRARGGRVGRAGFWRREAGALQVVAGEAASPLVERLHRANGIRPAGGAEGVYLHCCRAEEDTPLLVASGSDAAGLAYALYELAGRVQSAGLAALAQDTALEEYPQARVRGVDRYIMSRLDEEWWLDEAFWRGYLARLQACRFNRLTLITGFDTAYLTPPYPYFVEVPGFGQMAVRGLSAAGRKRNLDALRALSTLCAGHGMEFCFGSWQQAPWTDSQQSRISGLPEDPAAFADYCAGGMARLLCECPDITAVQLRVNMESGMTVEAEKGTTNTNQSFWRGMLGAIAGVGRPVRVDIRAKGATDELLAHALGLGLEMSVATKYWCEHTPLPYQIPMLRGEELAVPGDMNSGRRYSYGDLLRKPHWYGMLYRLWNYGSTNLFLWGSADYVRRFAESLPPFGGDGFSVNAPLSLKGGMEDVAADAPWRARLGEATAESEDARYWAMYHAFGLVGYNAKSGAEAFRRAFTTRFGAHGGTMRKLYEAASQVMPLITTIHFPVHPSLHYWPELYPGAALFGGHNTEPLFEGIDYAHALPSDELLFYSIADFAADMHTGALQPKYGPPHTRAWLHRLSQDIRALLAALPAGAGDEMAASAVDFAMLAGFAAFHARKAGAALHLALFEKTGEAAHLQTAGADMHLALTEWERLSELGGQHYRADLQFNAGTGTRRCSNWAERLEREVRPDTEKLLGLLRQHGLEPGGEPSAIAPPPAGSFADDTPRSWRRHTDLHLHLETQGADGEVRVHYRHTNQMEGTYHSCPMRFENGAYTAAIPAAYLDGAFDLIVYYTVLDREGNVYIHPGVNHPAYPMPYHVVAID